MAPISHSSASPAAAGRLAALDSLRLLAATLVLVQHLFEGGPQAAWAVGWAPGVAGVALFFLISGYVIPLSVGPRLRLAPFLTRRLFRIYPLYLATLAALLVGGMTDVLPRWADMATASPARWAANLLLIQDFVGQPAFLGVSWTLIIELIWYGLFAVAVIAWGGRAGDRLVAAAPLLLLGLALLSMLTGIRVPLGRPTMIYAAILGFQFCRWHRGEITGLALGWSLAIFLAVTLLTTGVAFGVYHHPSITLGQAMGPWMAAPLLFAVVMIRGLAWSWLAQGWLPRLGAASYSLYLLHPMAIAFAERWTGALAVPCGVLLSFGLALVGYHGVERPGIAWGRAVATRFSRPAEAAA